MSPSVERRSLVLPGVLHLCLLALLQDQPVYGYELTGRLADRGLPVAAGSTYPLLARLEKAGLVVTEQQPSPTGAPRRYYSLSDAGRAALEAGRADWLDVAGAVSGLLAWAALSRLGDPRAASTAAWVAGLLPLGGGVAAVAGVVTAATQQFGVRAETFVAVGVVVLAVLAGTVVLARLLAVRLVRREDPTG